MDEFTTDEIDDIVEAMSQKKPTDHEKAKIPLRPPGVYGKIAKINLSELMGEHPPPLTELTGKEFKDLENLKAKVEVIFGKTSLNLKELASLEKGSLIPLNDLCDDLVEIYVNGIKVGRGEIIVVDGHFGVKIVSFTKN